MAAMRYSILLVAVALAGVLAAGAAAQTRDAEAGAMCVLKVSGMHCGACADTVEKAAKKVDGVLAAKASQPKGTAEIRYDPDRTSPEAIAKAIGERTPFKAEAPKKPR